MLTPLPIVMETGVPLPTVIAIVPEGRAVELLVSASEYQEAAVARLLIVIV